MFFSPKVREGYLNESDYLELYQGSIFMGFHPVRWLRIETGFRYARTGSLKICYHSCIPAHPNGYYSGGMLNLVVYNIQRDVNLGLTLMYGLFMQENGYHLVRENQGVIYERWGFTFMPLVRITQYF